MSRRLTFLMVLVMLLGLLAPAAVSADFTVTDGPRPEPKASHRLIVELRSAPLATTTEIARAAGPGGKLDVASPTAQAYIQKLQAEQQTFVTSLQRSIPAAKIAMIRNERGENIPATYQVLLNAVVVDAGQNADVEALAKEIRRMPNVARVSRDWAHTPDLYASLKLINAAAAWNNPKIGGKQNAGAGIKVASMDGGVHKDAPMFSGEGYTYPPGYPKGDPRGTNGKIIVARTYFRTWDPPSPGDENPWPGVLGTSHGTHTASTAAGNEVQASFAGAPPVTISGVAPRAYVMSYRVFYNSITNNGSFYNTEGIKALEDVVKDGADVLNNSWGGGPSSLGGQFDALDQALLNAAAAGVFVSMSNGNAGPGQATGDHPSEAYINVAAVQSGGSYAAGRLEATDPKPVPENLTKLVYQVAAFGGPIPIGQVIGPFPYASAASVDPGNATGCNPFPEGAFAGKAALIIRGTCEFGVKALNAQKAGATMFIVYNHQAGGDSLISMGPGTVGNEVTIPGVFTGYTAGTKLLEWQAQHPDAKLAINTIAFQVGNEPDIVADFSSRGPGVGNRLKPDIAAPGVNILAQGYTPGVTGEARHLGYGEASGTSMAAPHVTGAGALIKQIHPDWSPAWIKSALMTTSKYLGMYNEDGSPAQPLDMGAGRLDLTHAADPGVILDPPSLSYGLVALGGSRTMSVTVTSVANTTQTYALTTLDTRGGYTNTTVLAGATITPTSLTLAPNESKTIALSWNSAETSGVGEQQGYVVMKSANYEAHFPVWLRVGYAPNPNTGQVLIIDADGSETAGLPDYTSYYTKTLDNLKITYDVWDADAHYGNPMTLADTIYLLQYKAIILQTGDSYQPNGTYTVPTPFTQFDMDALTEYANNGGTILAFGQDFSGVAQGNTSDASFFYGATLGARFLQDSINNEEVFTDRAQLLNGVIPSPFADMNFDISDRGDGAGNQEYIDEINTACTDPDDTLCPVMPLLQYGERGNQKEQGYVAVANRDQVSLERPGTSSLGASMYFAFGLEGVNNDTGFNTREDLLRTAFEWAWADAAEIDVNVQAARVGQMTQFTVVAEAPWSGEGVTYRWDFGDGSDFTPAYASKTVGHTYEKAGTYTVRVEVTTAAGAKTIHTFLVRVGFPVFVPMVSR